MPEPRGEYIKRVSFSYSRETQIVGGCRKLSLYNIKKTEKRKREWKALEEATGEASTSGALDVATRYYLRMAGGSQVDPRGRLTELMQLAEEQGSVTPQEIADVLDVDELPVDAGVEWTVGRPG